MEVGAPGCFRLEGHPRKCRLDGRANGWQASPVTFPDLKRISFDPAVMGGKPCIRGMRVTVGTILGLIASGADRGEVLRLYPYLENEDITAALAYAAWRAEERELPMTAGTYVS